MDMGTDLSARTDNRTKKRKMPRRYLISLGNRDLQFVIMLMWNINGVWGFFCDFLGKIDNISSQLSPAATVLVPNTTTNSDLMHSL